MGFDRLHIRPRPLLLSVYYLTLPFPVLSVHLAQSTGGVDVAALLVAVALLSVPLIWPFPDVAPQPLTRIGGRWLKFAALSFPVALGAWGIGLGVWYWHSKDPSGHLNNELQFFCALLLMYAPPMWLPTLASLLTARQYRSHNQQADPQ
jgi:hypothetical protein